MSEKQDLLKEIRKLNTESVAHRMITVQCAGSNAFDGFYMVILAFVYVLWLIFNM